MPDLLKYLDRWNAELTGKYNARELQQMWRILSRMHRAGEGPGNMGRVIDRLADHEPFDYVVGYSEFYGLRMDVSPAVLIPRPETEELVEWILENEGKGPQSIVDIGTGSGCIAIALTVHRPDWETTALDISAEALDIARSNVERHKVKMNLIQTDILQMPLDGRYDVIVSNPPYITNDEQDKMSEGTIRFEPARALFTGSDDALLFYRRIGSEARRCLNRQGRMYFELNEYTADAVKSEIEALGFRVEIKRDMQGKQRMLRAVGDR